MLFLLFSVAFCFFRYFGCFLLFLLLFFTAAAAAAAAAGGGGGGGGGSGAVGVLGVLSGGVLPDTRRESHLGGKYMSHKDARDRRLLEAEHRS